MHMKIKKRKCEYRIGTHMIVLITLAWILVPLYIAVITSFMSDIETVDRRNEYCFAPVCFRECKYLVAGSSAS